VGQDWPSPHHHEPHPLPRVEDLPVAWEGYDRERVQAAFDAFYRHIAQLDATLRALESVDVFRQQAGDLRAELRSIRAAGWAPYPRGYALAPERSLFGSVPDAVPRIALEVVFLVVVAAVVAVASFSSLEIVAVMAGAVVITFLVELIAARDRRAATPIPAAGPTRWAPAELAAREEPKPVAAADEDSPTTGELLLAAEQEEELPAADDGSGWAAFAEPAGSQPLGLMGALSVDEERPPAGVAQPEPAREVEPRPEPAEPVADTEAETGTIARRRPLRRKKPEVPPHEPPPAPVPKHVRVLPPPESALAEAELPPWERGFDETDERR
jgi:hypothetical protein